MFASKIAIPVGTLAHNPQQSTTMTPTTATTNAQKITVGNANIRDGLQRLATQTVTVKQGDSVQRIAVPSFAQLVQTSSGRHIILTSNQQNTNTGLSHECSYPTDPHYDSRSGNVNHVILLLIYHTHTLMYVESNAYLKK